MEGFAHTRRVTIEWGHCDPAGIVFNPRFFEYFDHSTALLVEAATGRTMFDMMNGTDFTGIPVVETKARFIVPSKFGDPVEITSTVTALGRSSIGVRHRLFNAGALAVEGEETRVWTHRHPDDPKRIKGHPIPDEIAAILRGEAG